MLLAAAVVALVQGFVREAGPGEAGSPGFWWLLLLMLGGFPLLVWRRERLAPRLEVAGDELLVWQRPGLLAPPLLLRRLPRSTLRAVEVVAERLDPLRRRYTVRLALADGGSLAVGGSSPREAIARRPAEDLAAALQVPLVMRA